MGTNNGYNFYFGIGSNVLTFPITPSELSIKVGSNNKTVSLVSGGDINILKSPSLVEVEFDARFPMRQYPYARKFTKFKTYWDTFIDLKVKKQPFRFIVTRTTPDGKNTWDTNLLMALGEVDIKENADEGDDVILSFKLKEYIEYGVTKLKIQNSKPKTTSKPKRPASPKKTTEKSQTYTIKSGDCLWNIAKKFYGNGAKYTVIYNANKSVIENTAKKYGYKSSSNGHWIFPGCKLTIPAL